MNLMLGGVVEPCNVSEYGKIRVTLDISSELFFGLEKEQIALMSHTDHVARLPEGFRNIRLYLRL